MATALGKHAERLTALRALHSVKGRRLQRRFSFEGPTLLAEAMEAGLAILEVFATQAAFEGTPLLRDLDAAGTPVFILPPATLAPVSGVESPSGIIAVAPVRLMEAAQIFARGSPVLVLADLNDPANAGTLVRSAEAFGAAGVVFGSLGVDPFHPKVVRGAMGALFRLPLAVAAPPETAAAAQIAGVRLVGLDARGEPLQDAAVTPPVALIVGHERRGLNRWLPLCERSLSIPMQGKLESLSAGIAGSIALYELHRYSGCQESTPGRKSQDYRC